MMQIYAAKVIQLKNYIKQFDSCLIAFSGGVDSGVVTALAYEVLGGRARAVTATSPTYSMRELEEAKCIASEIGVAHQIIETNEFNDSRFLENSRQRCYWCKRELFSQLTTVAQRNRYAVVFDGTNSDDFSDDRPGMKAKNECAVKSPLAECYISKSEVISIAQTLGLSFWDKPSGTCFSSRIPFGEPITKERLARVAKAETIIAEQVGPRVLVRARDHGDIVRIEIDRALWQTLSLEAKDKIVEQLKEIGYRYVTLDLEGYIPAGMRTCVMPKSKEEES